MYYDTENCNLKKAIKDRKSMLFYKLKLIFGIIFMPIIRFIQIVAMHNKIFLRLLNLIYEDLSRSTKICNILLIWNILTFSPYTSFGK